jgi:hypothetical protein
VHFIPTHDEEKDAGLGDLSAIPRPSIGHLTTSFGDSELNALAVVIVIRKIEIAAAAVCSGKFIDSS